jgi:glycosyltransferase involved in cell wall biosynthesis
MDKNKTELPLITIITACYNAAEFLEQTIESVLCQTYPLLEYIIIDGGSTDGTVEILRRYESRLSYWHSRPDRGLSHAFNLGLVQSKGEWILFLNADDFFLNPTVVETMAPHLIKHSQMDVIFGNCIFMTREHAPKPAPLRKIFGCPWSWKEFRLLDTIPHQAAFTNRMYLTRVGSFNESVKIVMDYELFLRGGPDLKAVYVPVNVSGMREGGKSSSSYQTYKEARRVHIETKALSIPRAFLNFYWQLNRHYLGRLAHKVLDPIASSIHWPGRNSKELFNMLPK